MPYYRCVGEVPRKRHTQLRTPDGGLYAEELMGAEGFSADSALLYHRHPPTAILAAEAVGEPRGVAGGELGLGPNHPLLPRHLRTHEVGVGGDPVTGRVLLLGNADVLVSYVAADTASGLYRNAVGDECVFVESGAARCETVFGVLHVTAGDYVVLPASTTHRWVPEGADATSPLRLLVIAARGHIRPPGHYLSAGGQFLERAPYCERDLRTPEGPFVAADAEVDVLVRTSAGLTRFRYAHHPLDVVGWDGCLYPYALSIHDFEPVVGRVHLPPPVHQTFAAPGAVICSFCPRPFDFDPLAIPVPYNHANIDSDEVLFYVSGDFSSRRGSGVGAGSVTLHPAGFIHGPQPGSVQAALGRPGTDELAVMLDTFRPLELGPGVAATEDPAYPWSWARSRPTTP